jgi:hypothetical protein
MRKMTDKKKGGKLKKKIQKIKLLP